MPPAHIFMLIAVLLAAGVLALWSMPLECWFALTVALCIVWSAKRGE